MACDQEDVSTACSQKGLLGVPEGVPFSIGENDTIVLDDSLGWIECAVEQRHDAGDHVIFIGKVLNVATPSQKDPLIFYKGKYRLLAD